MDHDHPPPVVLTHECKHCGVYWCPSMTLARSGCPVCGRGVWRSHEPMSHDAPALHREITRQATAEAILDPVPPVDLFLAVARYNLEVTHAAGVASATRASTLSHERFLNYLAAEAHDADARLPGAGEGRLEDLGRLPAKTGERTHRTV